MMRSSHLGDDGEFGPERVEAHAAGAPPVDEDLPRRRLDDPEQGQRHRRLAGSRAPHDSDLKSQRFRLSDAGQSGPKYYFQRGLNSPRSEE